MKKFGAVARVRMRGFVLLLVCAWSSPAPALAATTPVRAGDNLQGFINSAACGDTLVLDANVTWTGNFTLPNKGCTTYITITSSGTLPCDTCRIGPGDSAQLGKIVTSGTSPAINFLFGANYYQFIGVEIASSYAGRTLETYNIVLSGYNDEGVTPATSNAQLPDHIIFDRVYLHGTPTGNITRGIRADMGTLVIKNSYISDIHTTWNPDTNCILNVNGRGPYLIHNNYLSCAGENFLSGGGNDPTIPNQILNGLTFTNNYVTKDLSWYEHASDVGGSYGGIKWGVKNSFELKSVKNALIDRNIFENSWADAQTGSIILFQAINQTNRCTWCTIYNVTFTNNIVRHGNIGMTLAGHPQQAPEVGPITADTLIIRNNLFYDLHGAWAGSGQRPEAGGACANIGFNYRNISFEHNTCDNDSTAINFGISRGGGVYDQMTNISIKNNIMRGNTYGVFGDNVGTGTQALQAYASAGYTFLNNVVATDGGPHLYPATTDQPSISTFETTFVDRASGHLDNGPNYSIVGGSPYQAGGAKQASDGTDVGVNMSLLPGGGAGSTTAAPPQAPSNVRIAP